MMMYSSDCDREGVQPKQQRCDAATGGVVIKYSALKDTVEKYRWVNEYSDPRTAVAAHNYLRQSIIMVDYDQLEKKLMSALADGEWRLTERVGDSLMFEPVQPILNLADALDALQKIADKALRLGVSLDLHRAWASVVMNVPYDEVSGEERVRAKEDLFLDIYSARGRFGPKEVVSASAIVD